MARVKPTQKFIDGWKQELTVILGRRGARSDLARWLAARTDSTVDRWKVEIARTLNTTHLPSGELVLAIEFWRANKPARPTPTLRKNAARRRPSRKAKMQKRRR